MDALPLLAQHLMALGPFDPWAVPGRKAQAHWLEYRLSHGMRGLVDFTQPGTSNHKVAKSERLTRTLTLMPWTGSGVVNVCSNATPECRANCNLLTAGKSVLPTVRRGRTLRTQYLYEHPHEAIALVAHELEKDSGVLLARLNTASDLPWEYIAPALFDLPGVEYYDYTKLNPLTQRGAHVNYRLVYSVSEAGHSEGVALNWLERDRGTAAVVFAVRPGMPLPRTWRGYPVVDGDVSDDRTLEPEGVVVGLRAKGTARNLRTGGFVYPNIDS